VILDQLSQIEFGAHYVLIYDDLTTFRQIYLYYAKLQLEENNELVLLLPYYELLILLDVIYGKMRMPV
jgi:hypothetical protein